MGSIRQQSSRAGNGPSTPLRYAQDGRCGVPGPNMPPGEKDGALSDVRVVDLTRVWAGPIATRILGDFGAHMVKISDLRMSLDRKSGLQ